MPEHEANHQPIVRLHDLIRKSQDALVAEWTARIRMLSPARELSRPVLVDHLPQILARLADVVEGVDTRAQLPLTEAPKRHALDRLDLGFDLEQVISEYSLLRQCILARWESEI